MSSYWENMLNPDPEDFQVLEIISGGQTGADQGGLAAGLHLGLRTGGWMPKGFRTDTGPFAHAQFLGMKEHPSYAYQPRTKLNVQESDGTLLFGNLNSPGTKLTRSTCIYKNRPFFEVHWQSGKPLPSVSRFRKWIAEEEIQTLNVAGNRESRMPGIAKAVFDFLVLALSPSK
jgi:hypothetical protein